MHVYCVHDCAIVISSDKTINNFIILLIEANGQLEEPVMSDGKIIIYYAA